MTVKVTHSTLADGTFSSQGAIAWDADHTLAGVGTMAEQNANNVAITGGTISGVTLPASNITGTLDVGHGGTGATTLTGYVKGTGTAALTAASTIPNTDITGLGTASTKDAGAALGVATLDAAGKVPISQIPDAVIGALSYQGTWNATTNTPTLISSIGVKGYYYVVSVAGTTNLNGITDWQIGDWAVFDGLVWEKVDNTDGVTSVNGFTGAVVLTTTNVAEGTNEYFTTSRARTSVSAGTGISYNSTTGVITNSSPSLGGDVVGPASATDNAIARYDTTTGKLIQNSVVTIDDDGNEAGINSITFDTTPTTVPTTPGSLYWDSANGNQTLSLVMANGDATQQIGEETYFRIRASAAITKGQVVMFTGTIGGSGALTGAPASGLTATTASYVMGIATHNLAINDWGYITSFGLVRGINTTGGAEAWVDGQILYYDPTVAGGLTKTVPVAPNAKIQVCAVVNAASGGSGSVFIRPSFGGVLGQYEGDVQITSPADGQLLIRNQTDGKWVNATLTDGTAISITEGAGSVTITNTAPDQTVVLTAGTGISTSGTYPSFTVTNTGVTSAVAGTGISVSGATGAVTVTNSAPDQTVVLTAGTGISTSGTYPNFTITNTSPSSGGTVTSVTGTAPVVSSGGNTPAISMAAATGSVPGYLTAADWTTFNSKQPAGTYVTSVGATSPVTSSGGTTPTIAMPAATSSVNGYLTSTDWTTFNNKGSGTVTSVSGTSGRVTSTGGATPVIDLATSGVSANTYGSSTAIPVITFDTYGRATTVTTAAVAGGQYYGTAATKAIAYNSNSIAENITILANTNGLSAGPITISTGYTVTVATGAVWVIV